MSSTVVSSHSPPPPSLAPLPAPPPVCRATYTPSGANFNGIAMSIPMAVLILASYSTGYLSVLDLYSGVQVRTVGKTGTGAIVGAQAEMAQVGWLCTVPWSNTTVLVPDFTNHRVTEVDFVTGLLVKVWFTGLVETYGVAATSTRMVVIAGGAGPLSHAQHV